MDQLLVVAEEEFYSQIPLSYEEVEQNRQVGEKEKRRESAEKSEHERYKKYVEVCAVYALSLLCNLNAHISLFLA